MRKDLIRGSIVACSSSRVLLGLVYPLVMTGISQVVFPGKADGSLIRQDGKVIGSHLLARDFSRPVLGADGKPKKDADGNAVTEPDPKYFQARPSATGYSATVTYFPQPRTQPVSTSVT